MRNFVYGKSETIVLILLSMIFTLSVMSILFYYGNLLDQSLLGMSLLVEIVKE